MATTDLNISGGVPPYNVKIVKYGDTLDRTISFNGTTLEFNAEESKNTEIYYIISIEDSSTPDKCTATSSLFLWCPYDCGVLPTITNVSYTCEEFAAELTFTYTSDTDVQISVGNVVNGDFYWQSHPAGTGTITTNIPKERASVIGVYKQNTEYVCKTLYTVNPECTPECTFTFNIINVFCPSTGATLGTINISSSTSNFNVEITEVGSSANLASYRIGNILHFTPIQDGIEHSYLVTLKETDTNNNLTGCEFSRTFSLTCGTKEIVCDNLDIVLCIDTSGSISGKGNSYKNGIKEILKSLKNSIELGFVKVGLTVFNTDATVLRTLSSNYSDLVSAVNSLSFTGSTNICKGLDKSFQSISSALSRDCDKAVILITDGSPSSDCQNTPFSNMTVIKNNTRGKATEMKTTPIVKGSNSYYTSLYAIGIGLNIPLPPGNENPYQFLQTLTSTPSDTYDATTFEDFSLVGKELVEDLCQN